MVSSPLSWLALFASYVLRARWALGRWPLPARPDPYELGFHLHHLLVVLGFPLALALVLTGCAAAWLSVRDRRSLGVAAALSALGGSSVALTIGLARANPWYLFAWFMD